MMKVTILGSGGAIPVAHRAQSGVLIEKEHGHESSPILVDCGSGVLHRLVQVGAGLERIKTIFLTHHHLDHMSDLLPLVTARWLLGYTETSIYGPEGIKELIKSLLDLYEYVRANVDVHTVELKSGQVIEVEGYKIECLQTIHRIPTLAYKFAEQVVIGGDTEPSADIARFAHGCKLLIHECSFPDGFAEPYHSTPSGLGEVLRDCNLETLVLTHLYPQAEGKEVQMIEGVKKNFQGKVIMAEDLAHWTV